MGALIPARPLVARDLSLLMYAQHMAATARSAAAKGMFERFVKLEQRRIGATLNEPLTPMQRREL